MDYGYRLPLSTTTYAPSQRQYDSINSSNMITHQDEVNNFEQNNADDLSNTHHNMEFHCHKAVKTVDKRPLKQLTAVSILCAVFMAAEIVGGLLSHSLALVTDAVHLGGDLMGFIISIIAIRLGTKRPNYAMTYGYYRYEVLGAIISILIIWLASGVLVLEAVHRLMHDSYQIDADKMLITACCGVLFNIIMGLLLHFGCSGAGGGTHLHGHSHASHNHSISSDDDHEVLVHSAHHTEVDAASMQNSIQSTDSDLHGGSFSSPTLIQHEHTHKNINIRAAFIHIIGDFIQSIGVCVAAFIIKFKPEYKIADPICTFLFSIIVVITTITVLRDGIRVLVEASPRSISYPSIEGALLGIPGVRKVHSLHLWALTTNRNATSVHLVIDDASNAMDITSEATRVLQKNFNFEHTTIQVELPRLQQDDCVVCDGLKA